MDNYNEQQHLAWLDERNFVVSFHEIPDGSVFCALDETFWPQILALLDQGYRVQ